MSDLALKRNSDGSFDLDFESNDLIVTDSLEGSIALSLGSNARERNLAVNRANLGRCLGGWWADALDEKGTIGGYLYEAFSGKLTDATAKNVESLAAESLKWLKDDGVAKSVNVSASMEDGLIVLDVEIVKPDGNSETFTYAKNWDAV